MNYKNDMNNQRVRFAPTCQVVIVVDKAKGIEDKLWYSSEDFDRFKLESTLYSEAIRVSFLQGSFDGEVGDVLGLERLLFSDIYSARRAAFKWAVLEEQNWQTLSREVRRRRGLPSEVDSRDITKLANVAANSSSWAKERAYIAGLTLQSNLCTGTGSIGDRRLAEAARTRVRETAAIQDTVIYGDEYHVIAMEE